MPPMGEGYGALEFSGCNIEVNIDYVGNDVVPPVKSTGTLDCACICKQTLGCYFWSYRKSDGTCWSKYSKAGRKPNNDRISGNLACCNTPEVMPSYADRYRGCCSWRNITGSTGNDGFYIISAPHENVTDPCSDGCTYTKIQDQTQHCLSASSAGDSECNSCNQCTGTDLTKLANVDETCKQAASQILAFVRACAFQCYQGADSCLNCVEGKLLEAGIIIPNIFLCLCSVIGIC